MGMGKEFKEFALKGNVIELAIAVVIGGAFGKIVTSFVEDILTPLLGAAIGKHARRREGHEAQLSAGDALRGRGTFGVLLRIWPRNLRLRPSRVGSFVR